MTLPIVSMTYLPTSPLEFARPCGNCADFEFNRIRTDSSALAASTTTRAAACSCLPVVLSTKCTPDAKPCFASVTSRTIASVTMSSLPVCSAGGRCTVVDW